MGFFIECGFVNAMWQTSFGICRQTCFVTRWGVNLVINRQCFWGCKSQISEGLWMVDTSIFSLHFSIPGTILQLSGAQIFLGTFLHQVFGRSISPFPVDTKVVLHSDSNQVWQTIFGSGPPYPLMYKWKEKEVWYYIYIYIYIYI